MIYGTLFTLPAPTQLIASTSEYSSPLFNDFLPLIYLIVGLSLALTIVVVIIRAVATRP